MAIPTRSSVIDMNDPWILSAYKQMLLFQNDLGQPNLMFENPNYAQQDVLQSLAHRTDLGLEYEYHLASRQAFISRPLPTHANQQPEYSIDQYLQAPIVLDSLDLAIHHSDPDPTPFFEQPEPPIFDESLFFPAFSPNSAFTFQGDSFFPTTVQDGLGDYIRDHPSKAILTKDQSESMETVLLRDTPQNIYMPQIGVPGRTCSISSQGRGRVGKMLSRVSSSRSTAGSMFSCFDSKSIQSVVTDTSTSSRRSRKAMDSLTIAAMNAVKAVGACWRCKLLRKQCDEGHRCENCPNGSSNSDWKLLGCKRGLLEDNVVPVLLCPGLPGYIPESYEARSKDRDAAVRINKQSQLWKAERDYATRPENGATMIGSLDSFLQAVDDALSTANGCPTSYAVSVSDQHGVRLQPLDECVKSIIWEVSASDGLQKIIGGFTMDRLTILLRSASLHQAKTEDDQLVAQSLICLKECLEVLSLKQGKHLDAFSHQSCTRWLDSTVCSINSMASLEANISQYIKEFSRVLVPKERMRNVKSWWLSVFYSLCIQNFVRQALLRLQIDVQTGKESREKSAGAHQYLHLALRLFLAYSRKYDPLMQKTRKEHGLAVTDQDESFSNEIIVARLAVGHTSWGSVVISSSKDYLKLLFEDEGCKLY